MLEDPLITTEESSSNWGGLTIPLPTSLIIMELLENLKIGTILSMTELKEPDKWHG